MLPTFGDDIAITRCRCSLNAKRVVNQEAVTYRRINDVQGKCNIEVNVDKTDGIISSS